MHLVKWLRKNNTKIMAVVVIVIMIGFVGGTYISQLGQRRRTGLNDMVAYFGDNKKITTYDINLARRELEILKMLKADDILRSAFVPLFRTQDFKALLLAELLFSGREFSPELSRYIKQAIRVNGYRISDKQINDIYRRSMGSEIYWLLLKNEAQQAGLRISSENTGNQLAEIIPQLFRGATYSQLIGAIVNRQGVPEQEILATFSRLLTVLEYAKTACSSEDITDTQLTQMVSRENETIDIEFVKFDSTVFVETQTEPTEQEMVEHFDKYRMLFAGIVSDQNPYGFGYKLPDRVQLEYIAVKLNDISQIVTAPTQEEAEEYYQKYREQFTIQVPSDPNDPNSPQVGRTRSYAEVAGVILDQLLRNKITSKADGILQEAKTLTEAGFENAEAEPASLSAEQLKKMAGDYADAADQLFKKYKIKVHTGQTGLLSAADISKDRYLGMMYMRGLGYNPVGLGQVVFAIDELGASELGPFDAQKPKMYENIGPLIDAMGEIMVVVRVIKTERASAPESINQTFSRNTLELETTVEQQGEDVYSVKEKVAEDLKKLAAMDILKSKAEEFITLASKDGWERAVERFNELYGPQHKPDEGDPNIIKAPKTPEGKEAFKLQRLSNLQRISKEKIDNLAVQSEGEPVAQILVNQSKKEAQLIEQLYSLVPQDANTIDSLPMVLEFKPSMSCYCLKNISVKRISQSEYEKIKGVRAYREDFIQSQSLAAVHFNPENILKRINFRPVRRAGGTADANTPAETEGAL
jgi:uncharacterized protein YneF (UPF0154 family)